MVTAITREVSSRFNECEITHIDRTPIDLDIARQQHHEYVRALSKIGCQVIELPEQSNLPELGLCGRYRFYPARSGGHHPTGANSRKPETRSIIQALSPYRPLVHVTAPATVDGGDVLSWKEYLCGVIHTQHNGGSQSASEPT